jgi:hypothetical protein
MKVTAERAIEGVRELKDNLTFDEALAYLDSLYTSYCELRAVEFAKVAVQVQIRDEQDKVIYRAGPL